MATLNKLVIDLSHWNTIPESLHPAQGDGVRGTIHKATEGSTGTDSKYASRRFLAKDAGLLFGAYHFLRPGDMRAQADHFLDVAEPDLNMLLAADHEDNRVSLSDLQAWLERVEDQIGRRPVIYSGHVLKEQLKGKHPTINGTNYRLWLAQYSTSPTLPPGWDSYWLWQYSQEGEVDGILPPVDLNDYQGTEAELAATWSGGDAVPVPEPAPSGDTLTPRVFQLALQVAGFYDGEIDGLSGPMTRDAVDNWFEDGSPLEI